MSDELQSGISAQQARFAGRSGSSALRAYSELVVGSGGLLQLLAYELYGATAGALPGALGMVARRAALPLLLKRSGGKLAVGKGVTIRQPGAIALGTGVILDDFSVLDCRNTEREASIVLDDQVLIGRSSILVSKGGTIHLHRGVNISSFCRIATQSTVEIGEGALIAAYAYIGPGNHQIGDLSKPIIEQPMEIRGGTYIGSGAWIGAHSIVVDGVRIGRDAVIGANSLVLNDVPDRAVAAGSPAKIIRYRDSELRDSELRDSE